MSSGAAGRGQVVQQDSCGRERGPGRATGGRGSGVEPLPVLYEQGHWQSVPFGLGELRACQEGSLHSIYEILTFSGEGT